LRVYHCPFCDQRLTPQRTDESVAIEAMAAHIEQKHDFLHILATLAIRNEK